jgi:hypothetical protein
MEKGELRNYAAPKHLQSQSYSQYDLDQVAERATQACSKALDKRVSELHTLLNGNLMTF